MALSFTPEEQAYLESLGQHDATIVTGMLKMAWRCGTLDSAAVVREAGEGLKGCGPMADLARELIEAIADGLTRATEKTRAL